MTFNNAAWAIDGATLNSALARTQAFAACSGAEGIVQKGDLKVSQLTVAGNGILVGTGSALILNNYQTNTDQVYTVSNPAVHTVTSGEMPSSSPSVQHFIVAIVVGDPEFSQTGHPWMLGTDPPSGTEDTFDYVRVTFIPCAGGATDLGAIGYPAVALARLDIPASTTTITNAMITDLRSLARPRTQLVQGFIDSGPNVSISSSWHRFPDANVITVKIPSWAVKAKIMGYVEGIKLYAAGSARIQPYMTTGDGRATTEITNVNENAPGTSADRRSYNVGGSFDVRDIAGETHSFGVRAQDTNSSYDAFLRVISSSSAFLQVYFEEQPV
jgi:hypothetical protein